MSNSTAVRPNRVSRPIEFELPDQKTLPVLRVRDLSVTFSQYTRGLRQRLLTVVAGLDVEVMPGELMAVVGSSGSGKSLLAYAILGILPSNAQVTGSIDFEGERLTPELQERLRGREIALVPQSINCLDPLMQVGRQVQSSVRREGAAEVQRRVFARYGLPEGVARRYPFQLSGGMARRVLVATAVVSNARLIIADEPTPGLDRPTVAEALGHLRELADGGAAVMVITHDIEAVLTVADRVAVLYAGATLEIARGTDFASGPDWLRHPYSRALWRALPAHGFQPLPGTQPSPGKDARGCPFHDRCERATGDCLAGLPALRALRGGTVRCIHAS